MCDPQPAVTVVSFNESHKAKLIRNPASVVDDSRAIRSASEREAPKYPRADYAYESCFSYRVREVLPGKLRSFFWLPFRSPTRRGPLAGLVRMWLVMSYSLGGTRSVSVLAGLFSTTDS